MLAGLKSLLQKPRWRTALFVCFTLLFYWTRVRPADPINDFELYYNFGFLAMGKTGVAVVDLTERQNPTEVTILNTYGSANNLDIAEDLVYVADGSDGLKILEEAIVLAENERS